MGDDLRLVIRELLAEELAKVRTEMAGSASSNRVREEEVSITSDSELAAFVRRLLTLAKDGRALAEIEAGRHRFRLRQGARSDPSPQSGRSATSSVRFEKGLITERDIAKLPEGLASVQAAKQVRFTPLAQDELRRRGVKIERTAS